MKVDDIKVALKRSDGAHQSVVRALRGDRMVIFKGNLLLVEQEDGSMKQFHLGRYLTPQDKGLGGVKPYYVEVEEYPRRSPPGVILRDSAFFLYQT